jgi:hypothetical protein
MVWVQGLRLQFSLRHEIAALYGVSSDNVTELSFLSHGLSCPNVGVVMLLVVAACVVIMSLVCLLLQPFFTALSHSALLLLLQYVIRRNSAANSEAQALRTEMESQRAYFMAELSANRKEFEVRLADVHHQSQASWNAAKMDVDRILTIALEAKNEWVKSVVRIDNHLSSLQQMSDRFQTEADSALRTDTQHSQSITALQTQLSQSITANEAVKRSVEIVQNQVCV